MGAIHGTEEGREAMTRKRERSSLKVSDMKILSSLEDRFERFNVNETRLRLGQDQNNFITCLPPRGGTALIFSYSTVGVRLSPFLDVPLKRSRSHWSAHLSTPNMLLCQIPKSLINTVVHPI